MIKWFAIFIGAGILILFVVRIIKVMLKTEKESKTKADKIEKKQEEYIPETSKIDINSSSSIMPTVDFSNKPVKTPNYFTDNADDEFMDYSQHMHSRGRRRKPKLDDLDLDGDMADKDFEYIPNSLDFSYLHDRNQKKKKPLKKELNELPTELKVLMLSDIFDRKFFD